MRAARAETKRPLTEIDPRWARGWNRILRGVLPFTEAEARALDGDIHAPQTLRTANAPAAQRSVWDVLGITPDASPDEIKLAFRRRAFETHPDRGGSDEAFRSVVDAHTKAIARRQKALKKPRRRSR